MRWAEGSIKGIHSSLMSYAETGEGYLDIVKEAADKSY